MSLASGTRLGSYEVVSALGAGGMGEVYRARDTKLGRTVALKVVSGGFTHDPERMARFEREAHLLASLNHPHVATVHGLEESGGTQFLVMELVEGDTLDRRIGHSAGLPIDEALSIARQVADALQAAHDKGIIHRDLKPANIALTADGQVKVLDFGLAKAVESMPGADISMSPTISLAATQAGVILGTAAYMAPEQARGKHADKRADLWAFGCVLYEMLTGRRAFAGEDAAETLAFVMAREPDWTLLPAEVPAPIRAVLQSCLEKDRRRRLGDIAAAAFVLDRVAQLAERSAEHAPAHASGLTTGKWWRRPVPVAAAALVVGAMLSGVPAWWLMRPVAPAIVRSTIEPPAAAALVPSGADRSIAMTPDGSRIVYRGNNQLLVRALDQLEPMVLSGVRAPRGPFISPDGEWVGFFEANSPLRKVAISGGPSVTIAPVDGAGPRGATWGDDGTIVFATNAQPTGLQRVSAAGGDPEILTKPDRERGEGDHLWPEFLPDGRGILFTITPSTGEIDNAQVAVFDLASRTSKVLIRGGSHARYVRTGHLVYAVAGTLRAVPFDLDRLEVRGTPAPVFEGVAMTAAGAADFAFAANGALVYLAGGSIDRTVVSVDRQGRVAVLPGVPKDAYRDVRVSPDGTGLALATEEDVWTYDFERATLSRLTTHPASDTRPMWTPDSRRIVFRSIRDGFAALFWRPADGTGEDEQLIEGSKDAIDVRGTGWSPDGKYLLVTQVWSAGAQSSVSLVNIERPSDTQLLLKNDFSNDWATVSPDGRWMAYASNLSGRSEIYVQRYPELGSRQQISLDGGAHATWARNGRELFFMSTDGRQIFSVPMQSGSRLVIGRPQPLLEAASIIPGGGMRVYDLAPDGRFIVIRNAQTAEGAQVALQITLVQNWFEELKRLVPLN